MKFYCTHCSETREGTIVDLYGTPHDGCKVGSGTWFNEPEQGGGMSHAPTPYHVCASCSSAGQIAIEDGQDSIVARVYDNSTTGNYEDTAKFFVRACNAHDDLLAACKYPRHGDTAGLLEEAARLLEGLCREGEQSFFAPHLRRAAVAMRAAIAKAEGTPLVNLCAIRAAPLDTDATLCNDRAARDQAMDAADYAEEVAP